MAHAHCQTLHKDCEPIRNAWWGGGPLAFMEICNGQQLCEKVLSATGRKGLGVLEGREEEEEEERGASSRTEVDG